MIDKKPALIVAEKMPNLLMLNEAKVMVNIEMEKTKQRPTCST